MGIGSVKAPVSAMDGQRAAVRQEAAARPADAVSRNIQNEISEVERQKQGLSSKREMSVKERSEEKQELQHELSTLNTRLRQRQTEIQREQKREDRSEELSAETMQEQKSRSQVKEEKKTVPAGETMERNGAEKSPEGEAKRENVQAVGSKDVKENVQTAARRDVKENNQAVSDRGVEESVQAAGGRGEKENVQASAGSGVKESAQAVNGRGEKKNNQAVSRKDGKDREEKTGGIDFARDELHSIAAGSFAKEQTRRRDAVIARMEGGIVILRGEIRLDEMRGGSADGKRAELKNRQEKMRNAATGIPTVKAPAAKNDENRRKAGRIKAEADEIKRSRDGVVVITHNAPWNQIW